VHILLGNQPAPIIFLIPVIISAYVGGLGPGLVSTALGVLFAEYFLTPPYYSFYINNPIDYLRLGGVLVTGILISAMAESFRRANGALKPLDEASHSVPLEINIRLSFGLAMILLVTIGAVSYRVVNDLRTNDEWVDHTHRVMGLLAKLMSLSTDAETGVRGYIITGNE
jgi:hypothetical protein